MTPTPRKKNGRTFQIEKDSDQPRFAASNHAPIAIKAMPGTNRERGGFEGGGEGGTGVTSIMVVLLTCGWMTRISLAATRWTTWKTRYELLVEAGWALADFLAFRPELNLTARLE